MLREVFNELAGRSYWFAHYHTDRPPNNFEMRCCTLPFDEALDLIRHLNERPASGTVRIAGRKYWVKACHVLRGIPAVEFYLEFAGTTWEKDE